MKVFVTGGTGAIGRHVLAALIDQGHEVSALARSAEKAAAIASQGAVPVAVSIFDKDGLAKAFAGHDAVINLATALPATADFRLDGPAAHGLENLVTLFGIESPGLTSSLAIGKEVAARLGLSKT